MRSASIVLLLVLAGCRGGESDKPPVHLIPNMDTQEKGRAYRKDTSGLFADGRVMRMPVEGTVAIGQLFEDDVVNEGLDADGGISSKFPTQVTFADDSVKARGKQRFDIYCSVCHGVLGDGKGPVAIKGGLMVPPPNFHDPRLKSMCVGKIYSAIKNGVNNGNMPSYAAQIPVEDRWAIIAYLRGLQGVEPPESCEGAMAPVVVTVASAEAGAKLYKAKICVTCHSLDGTKIVGPTFKGLFGRMENCNTGEVMVDEAYLRESITRPMEKVVTGYPAAMPVQTFTDLEVESLILFIKEQK